MRPICLSVYFILVTIFGLEELFYIKAKNMTFLKKDLTPVAQLLLQSTFVNLITRQLRNIHIFFTGGRMGRSQIFL